MRIKNSLWLVGTAAVLLGCQRHDETTGQDVKQKYADALKSTKDLASQNKDEFVASMQQKMKDLDAKIAGLAKKSEGYKDDAKAQADKALADLRQQRDALSRKFDELKQSGQDVWEKTKTGVASAWADLEKAYNDAKSKFN